MNMYILRKWVGLLSVSILLGAGPASKPATQPELPELSSRQQNLLLQLSDTEANIQAINSALKLTGYKVGAAYDRINSNLKGNELMDRKGGGPVRWDEFYGRTAKEYGTNDWGDRRPQQFGFVYKANNDQVSRAREQVAALAKNQSSLLERRQKHEADQGRLWATIAFEKITDREIAFQPLARFKLASVANPPDGRAELLRPFVLFLRTADRAAHAGLESVEADPGSAFATVNAALEGAYKALQSSFADATGTLTLADADRKRAEGLKELCKQLAGECKVVTENHRNALDRAQAKEDNSKLAFRGDLQASLARFAAGVSALDEQVKEAARAWAVEAVKGEATADKVAEITKVAGAAPAVAQAVDATAAELFPVGSIWTGRGTGSDGKGQFDNKQNGRVTAVNGKLVTLRVTNWTGTRDVILNVDGGKVKVVNSDPNVKLAGTVEGRKLSYAGTLPGGPKGVIDITYIWQRE